MASRVTALIWLCCLVLAGALTRQEARQKKQKWSVKQKEHPQYPSQFYTEQRLDHFTEDSRRWAQRYFSNFDHYKKGGPLFISIGGEGPLSAEEVSGRLVVEYLGERFNGGVVALEHRFYGRSQPFDSLADDHLLYLTSRQALHDLAQFQQWFVEKNSLGGSQVFCVGGSYPGALAAWYRLKFPNLTAGCWAASAPLQAVEVWPGFGQMVWKALSMDTVGAVDEEVPTKLYTGYERLAAMIQDPTPETSRWLRKEFNVCPGTLIAKQDRDSMEATISTAVGTVMQYNNTKEPKLPAVRKVVQDARTPLEAALAVAKLLNLTQMPWNPDSCTDNSIGAMYRDLSNDTLPSHGNANAERTWFWQTCNEFGYFQTATASAEVPTLYTRGTSSPSMWQQVCSEVYGISMDAVGMNMQRTNDYYGARSPQGLSRVFFSHGQLDAWMLLGITSYPPSEREVYATVANLGSHCVGLYAPQDGELPGARAVREEAMKLFERWGAMAQVQQMGHATETLFA